MILSSFSHEAGSFVVWPFQQKLANLDESKLVNMNDGEGDVAKKTQLFQFIN